MTRHGRVIGNRTVAGRVVKESYGAAKQQHTFTVSLSCTDNWFYSTKKSARYYLFGFFFYLNENYMGMICALVRCRVQLLSWLVKYASVLLVGVLVLAHLFSRSMTTFFSLKNNPLLMKQIQKTIVTYLVSYLQLAFCVVEMYARFCILILCYTLSNK